MAGVPEDFSGEDILAALDVSLRNAKAERADLDERIEALRNQRAGAAAVLDQQRKLAAAAAAGGSQETGGRGDQ